MCDYGGAFLRHDMTGEIELPNNSRVQVCDWTQALPGFMREADTLFIDPPWNAGNARCFRTKAERDQGPVDFNKLTKSLFGRIDEIAPRYLFIEMGKQYMAQYLTAAATRYRYVTFYNSTYYHRQRNKCYVIHATNTASQRRYKELEDLDEEDIIKWICRNHQYDCIGDLCMGRGLVGRHAYLNQKRFVGTELNAKRLAVLVDFIASGG